MRGGVPWTRSIVRTFEVAPLGNGPSESIPEPSPHARCDRTSRASNAPAYDATLGAGNRMDGGARRPEPAPAEESPMRLRHIRDARQTLEAHPQRMVLDPAPHQGRWRERFGNDRPLHLEIGMGKGQFVCGMAERHPDVNFLGMEKYDSVALRALQRLLDDPRENVQLLRASAEYLTDYFAAGEVDRLYLNFSDPWPRKAHAKRRLTHAAFLDRYRAILASGAEIHVKTDNRGLFEFTLAHLNEYGMRFEELSLDLHAQEPEGNVRTEYEEAWSAKGAPIYRLVARF